ncbi:MAG: regulatory protein RecX [Gammaproteobacteria bacterium]|nr:regulatory protein RecX [Gammaproteobacteria bacterium]
MNWLARREHSRFELCEKLVAREVDAEVAAATVARLVADGLISDARFAESFIAAKMRRGQGPVRIRAELKRRGVSADLIEQHLNDSELNWRQCAAEVRRKKFGAAVPADFPSRARQQRFLEYRGFTGEQIRAAMGDAAVDGFD